MTFVEHNNREKANKFAEYVTGKPLREYLAQKIKQYCGENVSVFDGAAGSGQLEQFISMTDFHAVEIQQESCEALKINFSRAVVSNQSFFTYQSDIQVDAIAMNPPFKQIEMIAKTYDVNPAWLVGWIDDEMMPGVQVVEKVVYKESPTARLPDYFNNNNDGKIIKWVKSKRYMGGKVWAKRI